MRSDTDDAINAGYIADAYEFTGLAIKVIRHAHWQRRADNAMLFGICSAL